MRIGADDIDALKRAHTQAAEQSDKVGIQIGGVWFYAAIGAVAFVIVLGLAKRKRK
jgi:hypothetical protein